MAEARTNLLARKKRDEEYLADQRAIYKGALLRVESNPGDCLEAGQILDLILCWQRVQRWELHMRAVHGKRVRLTKAPWEAAEQLKIA